MKMDLELPPLTAEELPEFSDEDSCRKWLAGLPLTNVALAQTLLMRQLNRFNRYPVRREERLKSLELLREPIVFVQDQCSKRFAGRPLPLATLEQAAFDAGQALWQELVTGYLHCLDAALDDVTAAASSPHLVASLAATRALEAMLASYLDACQANILAAPTYWRQLHLIFQAAEELKVTQLTVEDGSSHRRTAASAYIEALLLAAAVPHELRARQLANVADWARRWSRKVTIKPLPPPQHGTPSLCVDLTSNHAATFRNRPVDTDRLRWLELSELRKSIKKRLVRLAQGESPLSLHLGQGCEQPGCEVLLKRIYQCWCKGGLKGTANQLPSARHTKSTCQLVSGFEAIHFSLTGQTSFKQDRSIYVGHHELQEIATFGRITKNFDDGSGELPGYLLEEWRIVDQRATELHLERPLNSPGKSLVSDQLVAVRLHDSEGFILGKMVWIVMSGSRDALIAKINLLPGRPEGISIRDSGHGLSHGQRSRGLFLPDVDQLGETASMLIPSGWFTANRTIGVDVPAQDTHQIRLDHLIERGADFERVSFEWL